MSQWFQLTSAVNKAQLRQCKSNVLNNFNIIIIIINIVITIIEVLQLPFELHQYKACHQYNCKQAQLISRTTQTDQHHRFLHLDSGFLLNYLNLEYQACIIQLRLCL